MNRPLRIGILAFQGDVIEHRQAMEKALANQRVQGEVVEVRTREELKGLRGIIIPGGESTVMHKLCEREGMWEDLKLVPAIFGTCAGAIMLAKKIRHAEAEQQTLERMDIEVDRNAYGRQAESFEEDISTELGPVHAVFIRAPRVISAGSRIKVLAKRGKEILACEQEADGRYNLAVCFHPELTTAKFHEHFLKKAIALPVK